MNGCNIMHLQWKLKDLDEMNEVIATFCEYEPVFGVMAITYPQGNTGWFICGAIGSRYHSVTIGQEMYEILYQCLSDEPDLDTKH